MALKGLKYEYRAVDLSKLVGNTTPMSELEGNNGLPEKNLMSQVPYLYIDDKNEGFTGFGLSQSLTIIQYLEDAHPSGPSVFPKDPQAKARANEIAEIINSGTQPLQNLGVIRSVTAANVIGSDEVVDGKGFAKAAIEKGLAAVENLIASHAVTSGVSRPFAAGTATPTIADVCLVPQVYNAERFAVDMKAYPHISRVVAVCKEPSSLCCCRPENQPDAQ